MAAQMSASRSLDKIIIRVPPGMRDALAKIARANCRSVNAELVFHLGHVIADLGPQTGTEGTLAGNPPPPPYEKGAALPGDARATPEDGFPK